MSRVMATMRKRLGASTGIWVVVSPAMAVSVTQSTPSVGMPPDEGSVGTSVEEPLSSVPAVLLEALPVPAASPDPLPLVLPLPPPPVPLLSMVKLRKSLACTAGDTVAVRTSVLPSIV